MNEISSSMHKNIILIKFSSIAFDLCVLLTALYKEINAQAVGD